MVSQKRLIIHLESHLDLTSLPNVSDVEKEENNEPEDSEGMDSIFLMKNTFFSLF